MKRFDLKISGNSGKIPDPWTGVYQQPNADNKEPIYISRNKAGELVRNFKPELELLSKDPLRVKLIGRQEETKKMLDRFLKANNLSSNGLVMDNVKPAEREIAKVPLEKVFDMNLFGYYRAFLKIAYEATVTAIPEYLDSDASKEIADEILNSDPLSEPKKNYFRPFENLAEMRNELIKLCKVTEDDHFIVLIQGEQKLLCIVYIFSLAHCIEMDNAQYLKLGKKIVLFNDIKGDERKLQL